MTNKTYTLIYFLFIGISLLMIIQMFKANKEGFESNVTSFTTKTGLEVYDDFYTDIYDFFMKDDNKNIFEISNLIKWGNLNDRSFILDVGSGTGHHVAELNENYKVIGLDLSESMIKKAKKNYPNCEYLHGDVNNTLLFYPNTFSHISCFYYTLYYIQDKSLFFENCIRWLNNGGYLMIHLVDKELFISDIDTTRLSEEDIEYRSEYHFKNDKCVLSELIKERDGNVRQNEHMLYIEYHEDIIKLAESKGFKVHKKIEMDSCDYDDEYLYVLKKSI